MQQISAEPGAAAWTHVWEQTQVVANYGRLDEDFGKQQDVAIKANVPKHLESDAKGAVTADLV